MSGAINPFITAKTTVVLFSGAISAVTDFASQASKGGKIDYSEVSYNFVTGGLVGGIGFKKPETLIFSNKVIKNYKNTSSQVYKRPVNADLTVKTSIYNVSSSTIQGSSSNKLYPGDDSNFISDKFNNSNPTIDFGYGMWFA